MDSRPSVSPALLTLSALLLGQSIHVRDGLFDPVAMLWLTAALILCTGATLLGPQFRQIGGTTLVMSVLSASVLTQLITICLKAPATPFRDASEKTWLGFRLAIALAGTGMISMLLPRSRWRGSWFVVLAVFAAVGLQILHLSPTPYIDVVVVMRDSSNALLSGVNPYGITFPDIYGGTSHTYPPELVVDGRLQYGFVYPPLALLMATPAQWLGDFRLAQLLAIVLTAGVIGTLGGKTAALTATLLLFTPRSFYVLEMGWIEPFSLLFLALTIWCAFDRPRWLFLPLGLFVASKQHLFLAWPLVLLLLPWPLHWREVWSITWKSALVALAVSLPMILWDVQAFMHSAVLLQFHLPFRADASSYPAWIANSGGEVLSSMWGFVALAIAIALALWRSPRTPAGFAAAIAFVFFVFFAFNKQAFVNYYWFVIGAMCCAVAASDRHSRQVELPLPKTPNANEPLGLNEQPHI